MTVIQRLNDWEGGFRTNASMWEKVNNQKRRLKIERDGEKKKVEREK